MTLPPHIANAPTPRTHAKYYEFKPAPLGYALNEMTEHAQQLERQLIWLSEIVTELLNAVKSSSGTISVHGEWNALTPEGKQLRINDAALSALNEYKQGTKEL